MTTTSPDLGPSMSDGLTHQPWCTHHIAGMRTCHRPLPQVAGHAAYLIGDPGDDPEIHVVPAVDGDGIVQLTRSQLAQVLAVADAVTGGGAR